MKKAYETDRQYLERRLADLKGMVWDAWIIIAATAFTILKHFPTAAHSPIFIGMLILGVFFTGCAYVFGKRLARQLAALPLDQSEARAFTRQQIVKGIKTLAHKILLCVFTVAISLAASIFIELYRPMRDDYVYDAVFLVAITAATILSLWLERRSLIHLSENKDHSEDNETIETSDDRKHGPQGEFVQYTGHWWRLSNGWQYWKLITLSIYADVYIGWLFPHQHSDMSHMGSPLFIGLFNILGSGGYRSVTMNQK